MHKTFFTNMSRYFPDLYYWPERGVLFITPFCKMWSNLEKQTRRLSTKQERFSNLVQNICSVFHVLAHYLFTLSETELDYYH